MSKTKQMLESADALANNIDAALETSDKLEGRDELRQRLSALRDEVAGLRGDPALKDV